MGGVGFSCLFFMTLTESKNAFASSGVRNLVSGDECLIDLLIYVNIVRWNKVGMEMDRKLRACCYERCYVATLLPVIQ